jgi:predicted nucleotidyltransferase
MKNLDDLQLLPQHQAFVERFVKACETDERIVAAFLGGSNAKGKADPYSDIDLCVITTESARQDFSDQRETFLRSLGELVFLESFDIPDLVFFIFADGTEGELNFGSEKRLDQIHCGSFRVLLDKKHILEGAVFPEGVADLSRQKDKLHNAVYVFWHEMSHFITAIGRGHLWWARGQLEALRSKCVNLARLQNDFADEGVGEEPYFKIEYSMPVEKLMPLVSTFCPMDKNAMLQSAQIIAQLYRENVRSLAARHGIAYPSKLERVMLGRLDDLSKL